MQWSGECFFSDFQSESPCKSAHGTTRNLIHIIMADQVSLWNSMTHSVSATLTWTLLTTDGELDAFPNCCPTIVNVVPPATGPLSGSNYPHNINSQHHMRVNSPAQTINTNQQWSTENAGPENAGLKMHFPVLHFPTLHCWSCIFQSCIFW